ncbi:MAG: DUF45 domain-containing protein [Thermoplasmata archaeon]|nr:DUF45 domain-containing protein [Thermoplasmata archaeon]
MRDEHHGMERYHGWDVHVIYRYVKHPRIDLRSGSIHVIVPPGGNPSALLRKKEAWIIKKIGEIDRIKKEVKAALAGEPSLLGRKIVVEYTDGGTRVDMDRGIFYINRGAGVEARKNALRVLLRRKISAVVNEGAASVGLTPSKIYIKEQRTRWGSCSPRGNLSFNLRLVMLPEDFLRYTVFHEISHLRYRHHGRDFHSLLRSLYPGEPPTKEQMLFYWFYSEEMMRKMVYEI